MPLSLSVENAVEGGGGAGVAVGVGVGDGVGVAVAVGVAVGVGVGEGVGVDVGTGVGVGLSVGVGVVVASGWVQATSSKALKAKRKGQRKAVRMAPSVAEPELQHKSVPGDWGSYSVARSLYHEK